MRVISTTIRDNELDYWTGTVYTTNRRVWEHDAEFKQNARDALHGDRHGDRHDLRRRLRQPHPTGALLLVSDQPMIPEGVKTEASDARSPPTTSATTSTSASSRCA